MRFEWDHAKEEINIRKHRVGFDEAADTFYDPLGLERRDEKHSDYEERFIRLGTSRRGRILVTVFTQRGNSIRIISSRRATRREVKSYEEGV